MATKAKRSTSAPRHPEKKWGPFHGGVGVAVWLNEIQTDAGPKTVRSISISPRRYLDKLSGEWRDAGSYRPGDLSALILALEKAREHCLSKPLPGEHSEDERLAGMPDDAEIPY